MLLKDYYNILQIPPHATLPEIKQAYRRLAMIYHPDKTKNDPYANTQFTEIKEAYEVLTNPMKKENWLQERWYNQSIGKKKAHEAITPVSVLRLSLELEKYVSQLDVHRLNKIGLAAHIHELLSVDTIDKLRQFNEAGINRQIITTLLECMKALPLKLTRQLSGGLENLAGNDVMALERIKDFLSDQKRIFLWEKYKVIVIIILTSMICFLIYINTK
jgi:preprotein translocase subunit Sec63